MRFLYRYAYGHHQTITIFQNQSDREALEKLGLPKSFRNFIVRGSGVDLDRFIVRPEPEGPVTIGFIGRLLVDKGLWDFCAAAEQLAVRRTDLVFKIFGAIVPGHPRGVQEGELRERCKQSGIRWSGPSDDIPSVMQGLHIVCLPTYHEGFPKVLVEAAASGRAVAATAIPGCLQVLQHGVNGLAFPPGDVGALVNVLDELASDRDLRQRLGRGGREIVERQGLSVQEIVAQTLKIYETEL